MPTERGRGADADDLLLDPFLDGERGAGRKEADHVGCSGGERLLPGGTAAIGGNFRLDSVRFVESQVFGGVNRRVRPEIGDREPDPDGCLRLRACQRRKQDSNGSALRRHRAITPLHGFLLRCHLLCRYCSRAIPVELTRSFIASM
jgi:hypothetical protein